MRPPDTGAAPASGPPSSSKKDSSLEGSQGKRSMLASLASGAQLGAEGVARWDGGRRRAAAGALRAAGARASSAGVSRHLCVHRTRRAGQHAPNRRTPPPTATLPPVSSPHSDAVLARKLPARPLARGLAPRAARGGAVHGVAARVARWRGPAGGAAAAGRRHGARTRFAAAGERFRVPGARGATVTAVAKAVTARPPSSRHPHRPRRAPCLLRFRSRCRRSTPAEVGPRGGRPGRRVGGRRRRRRGGL